MNIFKKIIIRRRILVMEIFNSWDHNLDPIGTIRSHVIHIDKDLNKKEIYEMVCNFRNELKIPYRYHVYDASKKIIDKMLSFFTRKSFDFNVVPITYVRGTVHSVKEILKITEPFSQSWQYHSSRDQLLSLLEKNKISNDNDEVKIIMIPGKCDHPHFFEIFQKNYKLHVPN